MTVLSGDNANYATLHQTCGATLLAAAVWLAVRVTLTPSDPTGTNPVVSAPAEPKPTPARAGALPA